MHRKHTLIRDQQPALDAIWRAIDGLAGAGTARRIHHIVERSLGRAIEFADLMFLTGMLACERRIEIADRDQPWTGRWADVRWHAVPPGPDIHDYL